MDLIALFMIAAASTFAQRQSISTMCDPTSWPITCELDWRPAARIWDRPSAEYMLDSMTGQQFGEAESLKLMKKRQRTLRHLRQRWTNALLGKLHAINGLLVSSNSVVAHGPKMTP